MRLAILPAIALLCGPPVQAETLEIESYFPAASDELAALEVIQVEALGGTSGGALTVMIEDSLRGVDLGQGPWFSVIPASLARGEGDALLRGTGDLEVARSEYTEERERCVKDAAGKCTDAKEKYQVRCLRREFTLTAALRLIRRDGSLLWSANKAEPHSDSRCADQNGEARSFNAVERMLAGRIAEQVRVEFAPRRLMSAIRVDENRKRLAPADAAQFKAAVRAVKENDSPAACGVWTELGQRYPDHVPVRFNLGLCAELVGNDAQAGEHYRHVLRLDPRHGAAAAGQVRLINRARATAQIAAHRLP